MDVHVFNQQEDLDISQDTLSEIISHVLTLEECRCDEISVHFVDTSKICQLHSEYFDDPSVTDCISFPIDSPKQKGYCVLGEIFVCPRTAIEYAKEYHTDPYEETTLYLVHGILHLLGYDDQGDMEPSMRKAEKRHMKHLKEQSLVLKQNV